MKAWTTIFTAALLLLCAAVNAQTEPPRTVSLELEEVPLVTVLNTIAAQHGLNLVVASEVTGDVTMRLNDVPVETALDALLLANGYAYYYRDDVIIVKTEIAGHSREMVTEVFLLGYMNPVTAEKALEPLRTESGKIVILDRTSGTATQSTGYSANRVAVTDYPAVVEQMKALIKSLDIPERSILIEAKIIETTLDDESNLGVAWPTSASATLGSSTSSTEVTTDDSDTKVAGEYDPNLGTWTWGKLSVGEVSMILNMLEQNGKSRLVSDPKVTTLENHEAEFKFETIIPIQTINRFTEGAATSDIVTFEDEEVGISLKVTPRINGDGRITLSIDQQVEDIIGYTGTIDSQKPITASRSVKTRVTVNNNETVALGGLIKEDEKETTQRVPILGHIPLLGKLLFTNKSTTKTNTDLLILITPRVMD